MLNMLSSLNIEFTTCTEKGVGGSDHVFMHCACTNMPCLCYVKDFIVDGYRCV